MPGRVSVGVSLKMYFGHSDARCWFDRVAALASSHRAVAERRVELFVVPSYLQVLPALEVFAGTGVSVGVQDVATEDAGAFTGEVSGAELAEVGVRFAVVGHAERRRIFGDTEDVVAAKARAALRNGMTPVLCVGESERVPATAAATEVVRQLRAALDGAPVGRVAVAYEPVWAIGAREPAPTAHIVEVARALRATVAADGDREGSSVVYGGSAGPGLLTALAGAADGLFLGRFAHEPAALASVLDEADALTGEANHEAART